MTEVRKKPIDADAPAAELPGTEPVSLGIALPDSMKPYVAARKEQRLRDQDRDAVQWQIKSIPKKLRHERTLYRQNMRELQKREDRKIQKNRYKVADSIIQVNPESAVYLPAEAKVQYGCVHCDWKNTPLCPFGFRSGKGIRVKDNTHASGICPDRTNFLLSLSRSYRKRPSYAEWHKDYLINKAALKENSAYTDIDVLNDKVAGQEKFIEEEEQKEYPDKDVLKTARKKLATMKYDLQIARRDWHNLWKDLVKYEDTQVERETPKKQDINVNRTLTIDQIHSIMRNDESSSAVDAEYEDIDDKN